MTRHFSLAFLLFAAICGAQTITIVSGNGQLLPANVTKQGPVSFRVTNGGAPVANQLVTFSGTVSTGGTPVAVSPFSFPIYPQTLFTDANGYANVAFAPLQLLPATSFQIYNLVASAGGRTVQFYEAEFYVDPNLIFYAGTTLVPALSSYSTFSAQATVAGTGITAKAQVLEGSQAGKLIPNVAVRAVLVPGPGVAPAGTLTQSVVCAGGDGEGAVYTHSDGTATCTPIFSYPNSALNPGYDSFQFKILVGEEFSFGPFFYQVSSAPLKFVSWISSPFIFVGGLNSTKLTAIGGVPPYTFRAGTTPPLLPSGITLQSDGTIIDSGAAPGLYPFMPHVSSADGQSIDATAGQFSIAVSGGAINASASANTDTLINMPYVQHISVTGGVPPYTFSLGGTLPNGLTGTTDANGLGYTVQGIPTSAGSSGIILMIVDSISTPEPAQFPLAVYAPVTFTTLPFQRINAGASYTANLSISGGKPPYTITATALPTGLNISGNAIVGTPTTPGVVNTPVTIKDSLGQIASGTLSFGVSAGAFTAPAFTANAIAGIPFNTSAKITGGVPPLTYSLASGSAQVTLTQTGSISATFTTPGTQTISVVASDATQNSATEVITVVVAVGTPTIGGIVNGASFLPGAIAPGQIIAIFGTSLGPVVGAAGVLDSKGNVSTGTAPATTVSIGNIPAPIIYSGVTQVNAIVPFGVTPGATNVPVAVQYNGTTSAVFNTSIAQSAPGIFQVPGSSQAAVINQDGTPNTPLNPAPVGSIVSIYATGGGILATPLVDGQLAPGADTIADTFVSIGGITATVQYGGVAPGFAGLLQINATVPPIPQTGPSVPIILSIGTATSALQTATIAVK